MINFTKNGTELVEKDEHGFDAVVSKPYTHLLYKTSHGSGGLIKVTLIEAEAAVLELHQSIMANPPRASFIVLHPLDYDGSEYIFAGTIIEMRRITADAAQALKDAAQAEEDRQQAERDANAATEKALANIAASQAGGGLVVPRRR